MTTPYIGRFAPSPSGPLHFGSLIAALGSFLQARAQQGLWRVRIEDIDPPREVAGADSDILRALDAYGLHWDGEVVYQSARHDAYDAVLSDLFAAGRLYGCACTRREIAAAGGLYQGQCRTRGLALSCHAQRFVNQAPVAAFVDQLQGPICVPTALANEDFILRRRDGLYGYNLAVVVDDIAAGITEVVRGADLLEPTVRQIALYQALAALYPAQIINTPQWLHLPLALEANGQKLSKQNHARALPLASDTVRATLLRALTFLGQTWPPALAAACIDEIIVWAISHWQLTQVPRAARPETA
ncbi:MAG: tRNA glutamyl-Q(34) synthetase GluQRS [Aeromonas sp.]